MEHPIHETLYDTSILGIRVAFRTTPGGYRPLHWHEEIEIMFPLNGDMEITVEGKTHKLPVKSFSVVESCQVHRQYTEKKTSMFLCIQISKKQLQSYIPDIELLQIHCIPADIPKELLPEYLLICDSFAELTRLYIQDSPTFRLEAEGIVLQALSKLLRYFSVSKAPASLADQTSIERIRQVITYVEQHFREPLSLQDAADFLGINREYFCRFFKKNMGISFLHYLNEVRLAHVYHDLQNTDTPISELMEANGFTNQKLFNREFKKLYGCTPSSVRKK